MTVCALLGGAALAVGYQGSAQSSDHQDSPATLAAPAADIADLYAWTDSAESGRVVLAMTVYPSAPSGAGFDPHVQYVFHTASGSTLGSTSSPVDVIATFDDNQLLSLWVGTQEVVLGDASLISGLESADGKVKVFAGPRADPFFFNLGGFGAAVAGLQRATGTSIDGGCPSLGAGVASTIATQLGRSADGGAASNDYASQNVLALVVELDASLVTQGGPLVSVWAATYATGSAVDAGGQ
jgi:hypothetical protein